MPTTTRVADPNVNGAVYTDNLNDALEALDTCHSGATEPTDEVANGKFWLDTSTNPQTLKVRRDGAWYAVAVNSGTDLWVDYANSRVGIGTTNPSQALEVRGAAARIRVTDTDTSGTTGIEFVDSGGVVDAEIEVGNSTQYFAVKTSGSEAVRIDSAGNVGIGTDSPSTTLEVSGDTLVNSGALGTTAGNELVIATQKGTTTNQDNLVHKLERVTDGSSWTTARHKLQRKVDAADMGYIGLGNNTSDLITFGKGSTEYVRIDNSGNVGIGTDDPQTELEVYGWGDTIRSTSNVGNSNFLSFHDTTSRKGYFGYGGTTDDMTVSNDRNGYFRINVAGAERARIKSDGNFGIGVTDPTQKLDVNGTVQATSIKLNGVTFTNAPIGEGQQWYNDGAITAGTVYQNTIGRPIQVMLSMQGSGSKTLGLSHDGTTWVETLNMDNDGSDHDVNTTFTVPAGHRYRVTGAFTNGRRLVLR